MGTREPSPKSSLSVPAAEALTGLNSRGGRPPGPSPWKHRKAAYRKAYMKAYMRDYRARKKSE